MNTNSASDAAKKKGDNSDSSLSSQFCDDEESPVCFLEPTIPITAIGIKMFNVDSPSAVYDMNFSSNPIDWPLKKRQSHVTDLHLAEKDHSKMTVNWKRRS